MISENLDVADETNDYEEFSMSSVTGHDTSDDDISKSTVCTEESSVIDNKTIEISQTSPCMRLILKRIVLRVIAIIIIIIMFHFLPMKQWIQAYLDSAERVKPGWRELYYIAGATTFHALSPTGYLPTVLAGITFSHLYEAWPVAYISVTLGAAINLLIVRKCFKRIALLVTKRKIDGFKFLQKMINAKPFTTVFIFRCPYLYVGLANYLFALSNIEAKVYLIANAIGFLPGSFLFVLLGYNARNLFQMVSQGHWSAEELAILISLFIITGVCVVAGMIIGKRVLRKSQEESLNKSLLGTSSPVKEVDHLISV